MKYHQSTRRFITSIIKQRQALIKTQANRKNVIEMHNTCARLNKLMEAYLYASDELMANFVLNHQWEIQSIIPGQGSLCCNTQFQKFKDILKQAQQITNINQPAVC